jgi:hypothetical protein
MSSAMTSIESSAVVDVLNLDAFKAGESDGLTRSAPSVAIGDPSEVLW